MQISEIILGFPIEIMPSIMSQKEMLIRLKNGEDPIKLSVEKWEGICELIELNLENPDHSWANFPYRGRNCAACEVYYDTKAARRGEWGCVLCPVKCLGAWSLFQDAMDFFEGDQCPAQELLIAAQSVLKVVKNTSV